VALAPRLWTTLLALGLLLFLQISISTAATGALNDVQHVVIFMQENRSFDEYFGTLKGVRGFSDRTVLRMPNGNTDLFQPSGSG